MKVIVTRHPALVQVLQELGLIGSEFKLITHVTEKDVAGKHVFGVLPLELAEVCASLTTIPINIPENLRGKELSADQVRQFMGEPRTFIVHGFDNVDDANYWAHPDMES